MEKSQNKNRNGVDDVETLPSGFIVYFHIRKLFRK
jgi:hypothetical protein